jgi:ribosomal protein S18 acetylase RimI-like enzyme
MAPINNFINALLRFRNSFRRPSKRTNTRLLNQRGESLDSFIIREATVQDIPALAALPVKTWSDTYPDVKKPPTFETREWQWRKAFFEENDGSWFCFVMENSQQQLIGFAKGKKYAHSDLPDFSGELNQIYLLSGYQRMGLGKRLVCHVARRFLSRGIDSMVLFGVPYNPSCAFHEAIGGKKLLAKNGEFHGGYGWRDLQRLVSFCPAG